MKNYDLKILGVKLLLLFVTVVYGLLINDLRNRIDIIYNKCNIKINGSDNNDN